MAELTKEEGKPVRIGDVEIKNPLVLGPMAGVTDLPFRLICHEMGAGLVSMEMVSANAVRHGNQKTFDLIDIDQREHPVAMQLFGPDAETMVYAEENLKQVPYDILDINMGCPVPKIVKNGEGSALLLDLPRAEKIVRDLARVSDRPVTVKIRRGFDDRHLNCVEAAKRFEAAGAAAIAVHGRTREEYYTGHADWTCIRQVKEAVSIPVIGNGDVNSPQKAKQMLEETGCDLVMIARGARGNPWIFRDTLHYLRTGDLLPRPSVEEVRALMLRHMDMQLKEKGDFLGVRQMRKHIAWYTQGFYNSAALRGKINQAQSPEEIEGILDQWVIDAHEAEERAKNG